MFAGYLTLPAHARAPGLIVLPEVFNTNPHIRSVADGYAASGFVALARERGQNREDAMREYLTWEINLVKDTAMDDDHRFRVITG